MVAAAAAVVAVAVVGTAVVLVGVGVSTDCVDAGGVRRLLTLGLVG